MIVNVKSLPLEIFNFPVEGIVRRWRKKSVKFSQGRAIFWGVFFLAVIFPGFIGQKLYLPVLADEEDATRFSCIPQIKTSFLSRNCSRTAAGPVVEKATCLDIGLMLGVEEKL